MEIIICTSCEYYYSRTEFGFETFTDQRQSRCKSDALRVFNQFPSVFEKTCAATQKNVASHVFWILKSEKKRKIRRLFSNTGFS